jgi:hypothetical protein
MVSYQKDFPAQNKVTKLASRKFMDSTGKTTFSGWGAVGVFVAFLALILVVFLASSALYAWAIMVILGAIGAAYQGFWYCFGVVLLIRVCIGVVRSWVK